MFDALKWLFEYLWKEGSVIRQAPVIFFSVLLAITAGLFLMLRFWYGEALTRQKEIAASLRTQLDLQPGSITRLSSVENQVRDLTAENKELRARLQPTLEVLFGSEWPFIRKDMSVDNKVL